MSDLCADDPVHSVVAVHLAFLVGVRLGDEQDVRRGDAALSGKHELCQPQAEFRFGKVPHFVQRDALHGAMVNGHLQRFLVQKQHQLVINVHKVGLRMGGKVVFIHCEVFLSLHQ